MTLQPYKSDQLAEQWQQVDPGPLTDADYEALKDAMSDYKYLLFVKLLRCTGVRKGELLSRHPEHCQRVYVSGDMSYAILFHRSKKGDNGDNNDRLDPLFIPVTLGLELDNFIQERSIKPREPIFQGHKPGVTLSSRAVEKAFERASKLIGRRVTAHMLRHYFSNWYLDRGASPHDVSQLLGHNDVKTTLQHYHEQHLEKRRHFGEVIKP